MSGYTAVQAVLRAIRPSLRGKCDQLAIAIHAFMLAEGYKLVATGKASDELQDIKQDSEEVGLDGWQGLENAYSFAYVHAEDAKRKPVHVTALEMGEALVAHFHCPGTELPPSTAELDFKTYSPGATGSSGAPENLEKLLRSLETALGDATQEAEGPAASGSATAGSSLREQPPKPGSSLRGLRDLSDISGDDVRPQGIPSNIGGVPGIIGDPDDVLTGPPGIGGMHVGPGDPIFAGRFPRPGGRHPTGPMPGIRYDPTNPEGLEGFNAEDFQRRPGRQLHPDIMPPGGGFERGSNLDPSFM